jgi:hypothetical protein
MDRMTYFVVQQCARQHALIVAGPIIVKDQAGAAHPHRCNDL